MLTCFSDCLNKTLSFLYNCKDDSPVTPVVLNIYFVHGSNFPNAAIENSLRLQYALCLALGVKKVAAYIDFFMSDLLQLIVLEFFLQTAASHHTTEW